MWHGMALLARLSQGLAKTVSKFSLLKSAESLPPDAKGKRKAAGFPDTFKIPTSDTQACKRYGNSVVAPLIGFFAKLLAEELKRLDLVETH